MNFQYHNPIKFIFGSDAYAHISEICKNHKVMLVYGGGSIKRNGVYERITKILEDNHIEYVDYGNQTTTTYLGIMNGIELAKREKIDAIIEIGGASAMDTGKAIAFGAVHDNLEDYIEGRLLSDNKHLLNIVIPTYTSTGSEANSVCDIMEYKGGGAELFGAWSDYCLMDASATLSLDYKSTAYSVWVCFIQTSAWFLGNHENDIAKGFAKTVLKVLLESYNKILENPQDIKARENIMWASCVDTMGVFRSGVDNFYPWTLYSVGYIPRVMHNVSYREALVTAYPNWLKAISKYHMEDIKGLFTEVFDISPKLEDDEIINSGCEYLKKLIKRSGLSLTLSSHGKCPSIKEVVKSLDEADFGEFTHEEMYNIITDCYK